MTLSARLASLLDQEAIVDGLFNAFAFLGAGLVRRGRHCW